MPMEIRLMGFEVVEKEVKRSGDSGRIYVPVTWVGTRVRAIRMERLKHKDPEHPETSGSRPTDQANDANQANTTHVQATEGKTGSPLVA